MMPAQWISRIHKALTEAKDNGDIDYTFSENVSPTDAQRVQREYANKGYKLIVGDA